jgi:hypothetical protein
MPGKAVSLKVTKGTLGILALSSILGTLGILVHFRHLTS